MKTLKLLLRIWIGTTSVFVFLASWIMLGHSPKPISNPSSLSSAALVAPLPTLAPLPPIGSGNNSAGGGTNFMFVQPPVNQMQRPVFITRGS